MENGIITLVSSGGVLMIFCEPKLKLVVAGVLNVKGSRGGSVASYITRRVIYVVTE